MLRSVKLSFKEKDGSNTRSYKFRVVTEGTAVYIVFHQDDHEKEFMHGMYCAEGIPIILAVD